jgi:hypothetical protein
VAEQEAKRAELIAVNQAEVTVNFAKGVAEAPRLLKEESLRQFKSEVQHLEVFQ